MARLTPVSWPDLVKRLKQLGLKGPYYGTKHPYMMKGDKTVILPNPHHGEDISVDFLARFIKRRRNQPRRMVFHRVINTISLITPSCAF